MPSSPRSQDIKFPVLPHNNACPSRTVFKGENMVITHVLRMSEHARPRAVNQRSFPLALGGCAFLCYKKGRLLLRKNVQLRLVTRNNRQMHDVLFGLASSSANKEPKIKLSLQKYSANDSSYYSTARIQILCHGKWRVSPEPRICLDLSLLGRRKVGILWNEEKKIRRNPHREIKV